MNALGLDTQSVLNRDYTENTVAKGLPGVDTPIFDSLASTRFAWDGENWAERIEAGGLGARNVLSAATGGSWRA